MAARILSLLSVALLAGSLRADDSPRLPNGPQPLQVLAGMDKAGNVLLWQTSVKLVPEQRTQRIDRGGGKVEERTYVVQVPVTRQVQRRFPSKDVEAFGTDAKKVDAKKLAELLDKKTVVLVSADGRPVDPFYLQIIKEGTVILVIRGFKDEGTPVPVPRIDRPFPLPRPADPKNPFFRA
jgi:hypothetical protein